MVPIDMELEPIILAYIDLNLQVHLKAKRKGKENELIVRFY